MVNLTNQRRVAASILKCGVNRVWIDSNRTEDVANAVTREDIRNLMEIEQYGVEGIITGKALYSGKLDLREAIALTRQK